MAKLSTDTSESSTGLMQFPIKARAGTAGATPQWKETSKLRRMKATTYESKTPTPLSLYVANFSPTEFKSADPNCIFQCSYISKTFAAPDLQRLVQRMQALSFLKIFPETNSNRPNQIYSDAVQLLSNPRRNPTSVRKSCGF